MKSAKIRRRSVGAALSLASVLLCVSSLVGVGTGCATTRRDALAERDVRLKEFASRLRRIEAMLPPVRAPAITPSSALEPRLVYSASVRAEDPGSNTDFAMLPSLERSHAHSDFRLNSWHLEPIMELVDPKPIDEDYLAERDSQFAERVDHVLALRYVIVVRVVEFVPPMVRDSKTFSGGAVHLEALVIDLNSLQVRASVSTFVKSDETIEFSGSAVNGRLVSDPKSDLTIAASQQLQSKAQDVLHSLLAKATGGRFF